VPLRKLFAAAAILILVATSLLRLQWHEMSRTAEMGK
jgi:hypothetical protein